LFVHRFEQNTLSRADQEKGRLRTFLLGSYYGEQDGECFMRWNSSIGRNDVRTHRANTMEARLALM